jgi:acyl-CoA reductase-like NAD-dependent aldehyde dehydrogenase
MDANESMTIATQPAQHAQAQPSIDRAIAVLRLGAESLATLPIQRRIELVEACAAGVVIAARDWVEAACEAKRIPPESPARAEEVLAGPVAVLRQLRLIAATLRQIGEAGRPRLPGCVRMTHEQLRVPVFPTKSLFDQLIFRPMVAETWLERGVWHPFGENGESVERINGSHRGAPRVVGVLGAGNVSSIPATDALTKILQENRAVLLKMNPVNDYLGPIFERALAPLFETGVFRLAYGAADAGSYVAGHDGIGEIHITGSVDTHDAIVWGGDPQDRQRRRAANTPVLTKPITSELGNVTPWIVAPGKYTDSELRFQVESVAASIVNNASFNCIATKVIVTCKDWPDRDRFLDMLESMLRDVPPRYAYYPGAGARFAEFSGRKPGNPEYLPWTLIRDADPNESPHLFEQESFVCVCAETALQAASPEEFLSRAVEFVNERLWGTLAAAVTVPSGLRKRSSGAMDAALRELRYGTIGVNQWPGVAYALMSTPWGGYPDNDLTEVQSGICFVHNTYLLDRPEKTILYCPLEFFPKPVWFPSHARAESLAWSLLDFYDRPSLWRVPRVVKNALSGQRSQN